ncbi:MAG TPA: ATP-binding protein [Gammaproteobacteria bacterium]|nr:ATP-binding protein [Gammaproteobacteria bacterium]
MDFEYELSKHQTIVALRNIENMTKDSLSQAIWEFNNAQLDTILKGLFSNHYIVGVKLEIPQNEAMLEMKDRSMGLVENNVGELIEVNPNTREETPVTNTLIRLIPDEFDLKYKDALGRTILIGKMFLYSSNKVVFQMVRQTYILIILNAIIKTISLWIFILWAGYYFISKPLLQLTDAIKQLSRGDLKSELIYKTRNAEKKTEINTLFDSFNEMARTLQQAQDRLASSRNRLNNIFDTMPSALTSVTNTNIIQGWNKYMTQITGIESKDAMEQNLLAVFPAFSEYEYLVEAALTENKEQEVQHVKIAHVPDSAHRLFHIIVYPVTAVSPPEVVIRIDDVTSQVKQENDLAQIEKLASVGASIAGVAHEINNPLASIMQSSQNIIRRLDPNLEANKEAAAKLQVDLSKQHEYLEQREIIKFLDSIRSAGERASAIVKNMLKFTRRSTADMTKHNIVEIINDALQLSSNDIAIQDHIDFKEIKLQKSLDSSDIEIDCYPLEIQQVLLNLIRNAVQAMDPQQPEKILKISLAKISDQKITITISDNGQGMPKEIMDQIYQPFFTTKPVGQGTGLGLSVCRNIIVQKHHGDMQVESTVGKGTTFVITLPVTQPK